MYLQIEEFQAHNIKMNNIDIILQYLEYAKQLIIKQRNDIKNLKIKFDIELCRCCYENEFVKNDQELRCKKCIEDGMVRGRRGWRQLGTYDG